VDISDRKKSSKVRYSTLIILYILLPCEYREISLLRGYLRQLRPYAKSLDTIIDRILSGQFYFYEFTLPLILSLF